MIDEALKKIEDDLKYDTEKEKRQRELAIARGKAYEDLVISPGWRRLNDFLHNEYILAMKGVRGTDTEKNLGKMEVIESIFYELGQTISYADIVRKRLTFKEEMEEW